MSEAATHQRANIQWRVDSARKDYRAEVRIVDNVKLFAIKAEEISPPTMIGTKICGIQTEVHEQTTPCNTNNWICVWHCTLY